MKYFFHAFSIFWERIRYKQKYYIGAVLYMIGVMLVLFFLLIRNRKASLAGFYLYAWFREVDDILDEEKEKEQSLDIYFYRRDKVIKKVLGNKNYKPQEATDILLWKSVVILKSIAPDAIPYLELLWKRYIIEAEWKRVGYQPNKEDLYFYAKEQDISILGLTAVSFGADYKEIEKVLRNMNGLVSMTDWLIDLEEDLRKGEVRIPSEELDLEKSIKSNSFVQEMRNWKKEKKEELILKWKDDFQLSLLSEYFKKVPPIVSFGLKRKIFSEFKKQLISLSI